MSGQRSTIHQKILAGRCILLFATDDSVCLITAQNAQIRPIDQNIHDGPLEPMTQAPIPEAYFTRSPTSVSLLTDTSTNVQSNSVAMRHLKKRWVL
jgi:hypothetical protein